LLTDPASELSPEERLEVLVEELADDEEWPGCKATPAKPISSSYDKFKEFKKATCKKGQK
jgi:hypothetical protein